MKLLSNCKIILSFATLICFLAILSCVGQNPFETAKFEINIFEIENNSNDSIKIAYSFKHLYDIVNDTSKLIKPNTKYAFYSSDFSNDGPSNPQEALTSASIIILSGGSGNGSFNIQLSGWQKENYSDKYSTGIRYTYVYNN